MENGTNNQITLMKLYTVDQPIPNWVLEHRDDIYFDVLIQCEESLKTFENSYRIEVALLRTTEGITKFVIKDKEGIFESLDKAMNYFVEVEKYELAARARDCNKDWKEKE